MTANHCTAQCWWAGVRVKQRQWGVRAQQRNLYNMRLVWLLYSVSSSFSPSPSLPLLPTSPPPFPTAEEHESVPEERPLQRGRFTLQYNMALVWLFYSVTLFLLPPLSPSSPLSFSSSALFFHPGIQVHIDSRNTLADLKQLLEKYVQWPSSNFKVSISFPYCVLV